MALPTKLTPVLVIKVPVHLIIEVTPVFRLRPASVGNAKKNLLTMAFLLSLLLLSGQVNRKPSRNRIGMRGGDADQTVDGGEFVF